MELGGSKRNEELALLYRRSWPDILRMRSRERSLSAPYFAWAHPDYDRAPIRLVVVGQETNGWGDRPEYPEAPDDAVRILMHEYREFNLGATYPGRAGYWIPVRKLYEKLNPDGPDSGFVAVNLSIMDQDEREPDAAARDKIVGLGLLPEQIRVLDPHIVVFLTGPSRDPWIDLTFPGVVMSGDSLLSTVAASGLPELSFRTYHPGYLGRTNQLSSAIERIHDAVIGAGA